jgi:hypothetical protein
MPTKIHETLQNNIRSFFSTLTGDEPLLIQVIDDSLMGFERLALQIHVNGGHTGNSIRTCSHRTCRKNESDLDRIYSNIIAMRRLEGKA